MHRTVAHLLSVVYTNDWSVRLETLFSARIISALNHCLPPSLSFDTVGDLLSETPSEILSGRNIGNLTIRTIWLELEKLVGGPSKISHGNAKVDVQQVPEGFITVSSPHRPEQNTGYEGERKRRWLGEVPIQTALKAFIIQKLTAICFLPNSQLLTELEQEVFKTTETSGIFAFGGHYGRLRLKMVWDQPGKELFIELIAQPIGGRITKTYNQVIWYTNKSQFLQSQVASLVQNFSILVHRLKKLGIPEQEIVTVIHDRLPMLAGEERGKQR